MRLIRFLDCSSNRVGSTTRTGYHIDNRDAICPFWWQLERVIAGINVIVYHIVPFVIRLANINALPKQSPRFLLNISRDLAFGCFSGNPLILIGYCQQAAAWNVCNAACQYGVDATITPTVALSTRTMTTSMINRFLLFLIIFGSSYTSLLVVMLSREMSPR